jgi:exodeoxyribonuclease VIII
MNGNLAEKIDLLPPGIYKDIPAEQYHALPYVSSSFLKKFRSNPASALLPVEQTPSMILGSASHAYSLEGDAEFLAGFVVAPSGINKRTNAGKEEWASFELANQNKTILTVEQAQAVFGIDKSLKSHPLASLLLKRGNPELTLIWDDPTTGLRCKARIDLDPERRALIDYKTCADVAKFERQMVSLNYPIQAAHYSNGATICELHHDTFIFLAAETSEPYPVRCGYLSPDYMTWAKDETRRLMVMVAECKESGVYPNYEIPRHIMSIKQITPADLLEEFELPRWL